MKQNLTHPNAALRHFKSLCQNANQLIRKKNEKPEAARRLERLAPQLRSYFLQLRRFYSARSLRRMLAAAALAIGLTPMNVSAQAIPNFALPVVDTFGLSSMNSYNLIELADLDNDGDLDLLAGEEYNIIKYYENVGTATLPSFAASVDTPFGLGPVPGLSYVTPIITTGDLDGDGDIDILAGDNYGGNLAFFENIGTATAPAFATPVQNPFGLTSTTLFSIPDLADMDGDGDLDLLVSEYYSGLQYFQNTGNSTSPAFATAVQNPWGFSFSSDYIFTEVADVDLDGDMDILGVSYGNYVFYENTGTATAPALAAFVVNPFNLQPSTGYELHALGDLDADGDLDLLASYTDTSSNNYFVYYENQPLVSVDDRQVLSAGLRVFPNPAQDQIRLALPESAAAGTYLTKVFDLQGRQVLESTAFEIGQSGHLRVDGLASGMYEVVMQGAGTSYRGRFMKQ